MRLTTKGRFAVTAMIDVCDAQWRGPGDAWPAWPSGRRSRCPIWSSCSASCAGTGWSTACAGPGGGYNLARAADSVSVADIIIAVDEPIDATQCRGKENCQDDKRCMTHELWASLNTQIFAFLSSVTLEQLVRQQDKQAVAVLQDHRPAPGKKPEPATVV